MIVRMVIDMAIAVRMRMAEDSVSVRMTAMIVTVKVLVCAFDPPHEEHHPEAGDDQT